MVDNEASWKCNKCEFVNYITYTPADLKTKIYSCCNCGKIHGNFTDKPGKKSWLECLPYKGIGATSPVGANQDAHTGEWFYGDPNTGDSLSRESFALKYGWDPYVTFCRLDKNKNHAACVNFKNRCKKDSSSVIAFNFKDDDPRPTEPY